MGIALFSEEAAAAIARMVRREMARNQNNPTRRGDNRWGDLERVIDAVASGDCAKGTVGTATPNLAPTTDIKYWNPNRYVQDDDPIVLGFSHRSGGAAARDSSGLPTPWVLVSGREVFEATLTAALSDSSSASATLTKCDGTAGTSITVYDNGKIGAGYHFANGAKLSVYYLSTCNKWYWLTAPCRVAD